MFSLDEKLRNYTSPTSPAATEDSDTEASSNKTKFENPDENLVGTWLVLISFNYQKNEFCKTCSTLQLP